MKRLLLNLALIVAITAVFMPTPEPYLQAQPATPHAVSLAWTDATTALPAGSLVYIFRGTASGAESTTPINASGVAIGTQTYTDSAVLANATYYYKVAYCATSVASASLVCGPMSNEVSAAIPLGTADFNGAVPGGLTASGK